MLSLSDSAQVHRWAKQRSVQITLSLVDDKFELEWRERGGPKLTEAPTHEGFGTNLVRRVSQTSSRVKSFTTGTLMA